jgi:hypothetical protein
MKQMLKIVALVIVALIIVIVIAMYPTLSNIKSEYATAQAIRDLGQYIRYHEGQWPSAPEDMGSKYPRGGSVFIDYSIRSSALILNPGLLPESVRPKSGIFRIYPHYDEDLSALLLTLKETNKSESGPGE